MKLSDYVATFLSEIGIQHLFTISGGGIMHLLDSCAKEPGIEMVYNLNEQATGICADSYAQYTNHLGACLLTTGPGATNAVTGCAGAWLDSSPVLFISGQTKTENMGQLKGLRQYGAQEVAIVPMVKPVTKYAATVMKADDIRYHLEKAVYLATHGRRGPVWVDIPLDIQGSQIEEGLLKSFDPVTEGLSEELPVSKSQISDIWTLLNNAKRPAILAGHGVLASGSGQLLKDMCEELRLPVMTTWRVKGLFGDDEDLFMGSPGGVSARHSNYVLQNTDFLLIIGTRLNPGMTAYAEDRYAPNAIKIIVDIDKGEIEKLTMPFALKMVTDAGTFLSAFSQQKDEFIARDRSKWLDYCIGMKKKYPLTSEIQPLDQEGKVDGYLLAEKLSGYSNSKDVFVGSSSGRACGISHMAYKVKAGQRFITSMGLGSMGWCLPSAISSCIASGKRRTLLIEGDGSLHHNLQELALIQTYNLPIKMFVVSNEGYSSIYTMQRNNFKSRFAGCNIESGLDFPPLVEIAQTYGIEYFAIENDQQIDSILEKVMGSDIPTLCEVMVSINFDEFPKSKTIVNSDGTFSSSQLENLFPFIPENDQRVNMPDWDE